MIILNKVSYINSSLYFKLLFLTAAVLIVFYPTIHAEVSLIDDMDMLNWLHHSESDITRLRQILIPGGAHGGYYRPLIGISFLFDKVFFSADPVIMHLEGILFHLINVVLVFFLTRECLSLLGKKQDGMPPFFAALLFGLHPITTESVNWISGRTDIMMGNFVLFGAILFIRYRRVDQIRYLFPALFALLLGVLAKEAAIGFLAGGVLICILQKPDCSWNLGTAVPHAAGSSAIDFLIFYSVAFLSALFLGNNWVVLLCFAGYWLLVMYRQTSTKSMILRNHVKPVLIVVLVTSLSVVLLFLLRRMAFSSDAGKIGNTIRLMFMDLNYSISLFIGAMGFYVQKFVFPWPLNFFILEIDPLYDFVGIAVVLIMIRFLTKNTLSIALFFIGVGLVLPVLPFVFGTIAWTSYAERYIYLPSAFWSVALAVQVMKIMEMRSNINRPDLRLMITVFLITVATVFSITTWQRNVVWQKNVTLLQDTVDKSPRVKPLRDFYMAALFQAGRYEEAAEQYEIGKSLYSRIYDPAPDIMMGMIQQNMLKNNDAYLLYEKANENTHFKSETSLCAMLSFLEQSAKNSSLSLSSTEIHRQILLYRSRLKKLQDKSASGYSRIHNESLS